jgi:hypothetical protein
MGHPAFGRKGASGMGGAEGIGVLRCAQDDSKNKQLQRQNKQLQLQRRNKQMQQQKQTAATAKQTTANSKNE